MRKELRTISREYEGALKKVKLPEDERKIIIHNLTNLEKQGFSKNDLVSIIIRNIVSDAGFKQLFMKDPLAAVKKVGINPVPTP
jgi:hypothetical protein